MIFVILFLFISYDKDSVIIQIWQYVYFYITLILKNKPISIKNTKFN